MVFSIRNVRMVSQRPAAGFRTASNHTTPCGHVVAIPRKRGAPTYNRLVSETRDVTVRLPGLLLEHLERLAEERGISISELTIQALARLVEGDASYLAARKRAMDGLRNASSLTVDGKITWTRAELHAR